MLEFRGTEESLGDISPNREERFGGRLGDKRMIGEKEVGKDEGGPMVSSVINDHI